MTALSFEITVNCPKADNPTGETRGTVKVNNKEHGKISIIGPDTQVIKFDAELEDGEHTVSITHDYTPNSQSALVIEKIVMDEIDVGVLAYDGVYTPIYAEPWYTDEVEAGRKPKETIGAGQDGSACMFMGWEGRYDLKFNTPLYEWLLENI
tara:strand:- start:62 stop:517 length:456 start_codon:yes stop_codon:yes gene_type:complete